MSDNIITTKNIFPVSRSSHQWYSIETGVLKNFTKFPGKDLCQSLFFNKVVGLRLASLLKKTLAQVFSYEFFKIFKNTFFTEHLWTTASVYIKRKKVKWVQQSTSVVTFHISSIFSRVINSSIFSIRTIDSFILVKASSTAQFLAQV